MSGVGSNTGSSSGSGLLGSPDGNESSSSSNIASTQSAAATAQSSSEGNTVKANGSTGSNNTGSIAGAAVGCFFGGIIIGTLIVFVFLRRRYRRRLAAVTSKRYHSMRQSPTGSTEKSGAVTTITPADRFDFLPQQAEDGEIKKRISTILDLVDYHIKNFYVNVHVGFTPALEQQVAHYDANLLLRTLPAALDGSQVPTVIIQQCLTHELLWRAFDPNTDHNSLLPLDICHMIVNSKKNMQRAATKESLLAFSQWKRLTAYLRPDLQQLFNSPDYHKSKHAQLLYQLAQSFSTAFSPWANPSESEERRVKHLFDIYSRVSATATWIFSQPDDFVFDWTMPRSGNKSRTNTGNSQHNAGGNAEGSGSRLVLIPTMYKTSFQGEVLTRPSVIVAGKLQQY